MSMHTPTLRDAATAVAAALCAAVLMSATPGAQALDQMTGASARPHANDDTLYRALGEKAAIAAVMDDFAGRLKTDERLRTFFKDSKRSAIASQLTDQICQLAGGPCVYDGANMKDAHSDMGVTKANFNALVEVLQDTMTAHDWPFSTQNQLLARLAPMHRDIITK